MNQISDIDLKKIQFEILCEFKRICDENNLNYSLIGGTLLGAVRHKGFIPWDDDIDVCMPRDDFNKFENIYLNNKNKYNLLSHNLNRKYNILFAKFSDPKTKIIEKVGNRNNVDLGVHIDIFIYDAMGETIDKAIKNYNASAFKRELLIAANWKRFKRSKTHKWYYEPFRFLLFIFSRFVSRKKIINNIEKKYICNSFYSSKYVGNLASDKRSKSIIEKERFNDYIEMDFETEKFKVFKGYEIYLKSMYGDYMKLPPIEKRISHHTFEAYYKGDY